MEKDPQRTTWAHGTLQSLICGCPAAWLTGLQMLQVEAQPKRLLEQGIHIGWVSQKIRWCSRDLHGTATCIGGCLTWWECQENHWAETDSWQVRHNWDFRLRHPEESSEPTRSRSGWNSLQLEDDEKETKTVQTAKWCDNRRWDSSGLLQIK